MGSDIKSNIIELCSTLLPEPGQRTGTAAGAASQAFHLPEDLSGPPPLRDSVAGREYHCRLTRSLQGSVPPLFPDGRVPLATTGRLLWQLPAAVGRRASSGVACPYRARQLTYSCRWI